MRAIQIVRGTLLILAAAALAACATLRGGQEMPRAELEIRVTNDLRSPGPVSVSLLDHEGNRETLGEVEAGATRSFDATTDLEEEGRYRLMAEPERGEAILSPEVMVREGSIIRWNLRDNTVQVFEARDKPGGR